MALGIERSAVVLPGASGNASTAGRWHCCWDTGEARGHALCTKSALWGVGFRLFPAKLYTNADSCRERASSVTECARAYSRCPGRSRVRR